MQKWRGCLRVWRGTRGVCSAGVGGHAGKSSPTCAPQPEPGPSSPQPRSGVAFQAGTPVSASPHASSAKNAPSSAAPPYRTRWPASATTAPPSFPNPGSGPAAALCLPPAPAPVGLELSPGSINPAPGAGRGLWGSRRRCAFGFQVNGTSRKTLLGPLSPARQPKGFIPAARSPRTATCRDSRVAGRAGLRRRRSPGAGLLWAAARGGEAGARLSVPERRAQPGAALRGGGAGPRPGGGAGAEPGAGTRGAVPGREGRRTPGLADAL